MKVDYIIVGSGLAGILFCELLSRNKQSFIVFDDRSQQSSGVAGGLYNPVILKRFTPVWKAREQLDMAIPMYQALEHKLDLKLDYKVPIYRLLASVEEQNNWFEACDNPRLTEFMSTDLINEEIKGIKSSYGFGKVLSTGRIDTGSLVLNYRAHLDINGQYISKSFKHKALEISNDDLAYNNIKARYIVFAEGVGLLDNPYFDHLPLHPTKGELLTIKAPGLELDAVLKSAVFLIPLGDGYFRVGSTYSRNDRSRGITYKAKNELLNKLDKIIDCDYQVVDQVSGVRPTVRDRRPLVGCHPQYNNVFVLNGLGTRGVMIAPYVASQLYEFIEKGRPLDKEIQIERFAI